MLDRILMEEAWGRFLTEKTLDWILMEETLIGFRVRRDSRRRILAESDANQRMKLEEFLNLIKVRRIIK